jgi:hypothetical protein
MVQEDGGRSGQCGRRGLRKTRRLFQETNRPKRRAGEVACSESRTFSWRRCCSMLLGLAILSAMEGGEGAILTAELA